MPKATTRRPAPGARSWRTPDALWADIEPLLPARKAHPLGCPRAWPTAPRWTPSASGGCTLLREFRLTPHVRARGEEAAAKRTRGRRAP